jgi:hypothetical protein
MKTIILRIALVLGAALCGYMAKAMYDFMLQDLSHVGICLIVCGIYTTIAVVALYTGIVKGTKLEDKLANIWKEDE